MLHPIGHNNPPSLIEHAADTTAALSAWMAEHPVIQSEDAAREGKVLADRARDAVKDMEAERTGKVAPLNQQVKNINAEYASPRFALESTLQQLILRLDSFAKEEEARREKAAAEKALALAEAERLAREAERVETEAKEAASQGELGVDIAAVTTNADAAFTLFKKAKREAALAQKESRFKIGGGHRKALSRRTKETLVVDSWEEAIGFLGLTDGIRDAILTAARAYRQQANELPPGISSHTDRSL